MEHGQRIPHRRFSTFNQRGTRNSRGEGSVSALEIKQQNCEFDVACFFGSQFSIRKTEHSRMAVIALRNLLNRLARN